MHKKEFVWEGDQNGDAIELAFSKKKIEARKNWLRQIEPGTHLYHNDKLINYSHFINKELILFSVVDLQRSIPSMVDGLKPGQRKFLFCSFKRNFVKEAKAKLLNFPNLMVDMAGGMLVSPPNWINSPPSDDSPDNSDGDSLWNYT